MKLYFSPASQYVRKVRVAAIELGLTHRIELVTSREGLEKVNPLLKRPVLITDDGNVVLDSPVICEYLNSLVDGPLIPADTSGRFKTLTSSAIGDGVMEAVSAIRTDRVLHEANASRQWHDRQMLKARGGFAYFDLQAKAWGDRDLVSLDRITAAVMCGYIDFAFEELEWHADYLILAAWYDEFSERDSMKSTVPQRS